MIDLSILDILRLLAVEGSMNSTDLYSALQRKGLYVCKRTFYRRLDESKGYIQRRKKKGSVWYLRKEGEAFLKAEADKLNEAIQALKERTSSKKGYASERTVTLE